MALTNYTIGGTTGGTWTIQNTDTAKVGRFHDLATLTEGSATNMATSRPGVLPGPADATGLVPTAFLAEATGSGLNISLRAGSAVVERSTLVGSYIVESSASAQVTLATADAVNSRVDRIDLQVLDGVLGDNGGSSLTQIVVTSGAGAPSGGVIPIAPAPTNSIPLGTVLLPPNTATVTAGMISRTRRSAGLRGAVRMLLDGDNTSDAGWVAGELRDTTARGGRTIDRWNNGAAAWETVADLDADPGKQFSFYGYASAPANIGNSVVVAVPLNTEVWDPSGMHDNVTNPTRVTAKKAGIYKASGSASFAPNALHGRAAYLQVNGTAIPGTGIACQGIDLTYAPGMAIPTTWVHLNLNDYVELAVTQNCGSTLATQASGQNVCAVSLEFYHV